MAFPANVSSCPPGGGMPRSLKTTALVSDSADLQKKYTSIKYQQQQKPDCASAMGLWVVLQAM